MKAHTVRDLIRKIRAARSTAEEKAVVSKECAAIRTHIKDGDEAIRSRTVAKLMFIHMLGYSTEFGQMECLKLLGSEIFAEKRIGYLGMMALLDEGQEVLTLAENRFKKDLHDPSSYVQSLALCAIANISSEDMARALAGEVRNLLGHTNPNVRKKASLCALRIARKVVEEDIIEMFMDHWRSNLFTERSHGVMVASLSAVNEVLQTPIGETYLPHFRLMLQQAVRILKNLSQSSFGHEHDVSGVADPFLQAKLLQFLRIIGANNPDASRQMSDILAMVATNTESIRTSGNAVLYECVLTIIGIEADSQLLNSGVTLLGRFLVNRDNNIRYVALNTLSKVVGRDMQSVQKHKTTIIGCLQDVDISIRRRALELIYTLVNKSNIRLLVPDLINYLAAANTDFKGDLTIRICSVVERDAPNQLWQIGTLMKVMNLAGSYVPESVGLKVMSLVSQSEDPVRSFVVKELWGTMATHAPLDNEYSPQDPGQKEESELYCKKDTLVQVSVWTVGEYCDLLIQPTQDVNIAEDFGTGSDWKNQQPIDQQVCAVLSALLACQWVSVAAKGYVITAAFKLACRFPTVRPDVEDALKRHTSNENLELQQRACEYTELIKILDTAPELQERMPPIIIEGSSPTSVSGDHGSFEAVAAAPAPAPAHAPAPAPAPQPVAPAAPAPAPVVTPDIWGAPSSPAFPPPQVAAHPPQPAPQAPAPMPPQAPAPQPPSSPPSGVVPGLSGMVRIEYEVEAQPTGQQWGIGWKLINTGNSKIVGLSYLAAVNKNFVTLNMLPLSSTDIEVGGTVTQRMTVENKSEPKKAIVMRLRLKFSLDGANHQEDAQITLPDYV